MPSRHHTIETKCFLFNILLAADPQQSILNACKLSDDQDTVVPLFYARLRQLGRVL